MENDKLTDIILLRLINNDRIIGQVLRIDKEITSLYAPMLIDLDEEGYILSPYDPLSDTTMAIMDNDVILTITLPKEELKEIYQSEWKHFYPTLEDLRKKMVEDAKKKYGEEVFDAKKIQDMFSDIINNSLPIDKSKLN